MVFERTPEVLIPRMLGRLVGSPYRIYLDFQTACLPEISSLLESGKLAVRIDPDSFTLATLAEAHARCETNHSRGKLVVDIV